MGPRNKRDRDPSAIQDEIQRLEEVLAALNLGVEVARATLDRLQDLVPGDEEEEQQGRDKLEKGYRDEILPRNNEPWTTRKYVGRVAKVVGVTQQCVWLKIPGRVDELRRNKEFVKLSK